MMMLGREEGQGAGAEKVEVFLSATAETNIHPNGSDRLSVCVLTFCSQPFARPKTSKGGQVKV